MVRHVMKNGTVRKDVSGVVVKMQDAPGAYAVLGRIRRDAEKDGQKADTEQPE